MRFPPGGRGRPAKRAAPAPASMGRSPRDYALVIRQKLCHPAPCVLRTIIHVVITLTQLFRSAPNSDRRDARAWLESAVAIAASLWLQARAAILASSSSSCWPSRSSWRACYKSLQGRPAVIVARLLLIIAYLSVGALLQPCRDLRRAADLRALFASHAFGYAGVGFPRSHEMLLRNLERDLPLRWDMAVLLGQAHGDCRSRNPCSVRGTRRADRCSLPVRILRQAASSARAV